MKHRALLVLALAAAAVHAQVPDEAAERERIQKERAVVDAKYNEAQKSCRAKFAVNDCLDKARREHITADTELKRQERVLNDAQRKRRAADAQRQIDEKNSPEAQQEAAQRRAKALADQQEREKQAAEKSAKRAADDAQKAKQAPREKTAHGASGPQGSAREPAVAASHGPSATEQAKNRAEYVEHQQEAEKHKADVAARNAQRGKKPSADLPPPPDR